jgi:hypothetical protein
MHPEGGFTGRMSVIYGKLPCDPFRERRRYGKRSYTHCAAHSLGYAMRILEGPVACRFDLAAIQNVPRPVLDVVPEVV